MALLALLVACAPGGRQAPPITAVTPASHASFAVLSGPHAVDCNTCHGEFGSFKQFNCLGCHAHEQTATDGVHRAVTGYSYSSAACYTCHQAADGGKQVFSHTGISSNCASCHTEGAAFAALPVAGFTHGPMNGNDCAACHVTASWKAGVNPAGNSSDPQRDVFVATAIPSYAGTSIVQFALRTDKLPMTMNHGATSVAKAAFSRCLNCHVNAGAGVYYPGRLHSSLALLKLPQPTACLECHAVPPVGMVGPTATNPVRTPPSGEMKHDAVAWAALQPTATPLVTSDCAVCHLAPSATPAAWSNNKAGVAPAQFHSSLTKAAAPQPGSCVDCHANTRPATVLTSATAALPVAGLAFDHTAPAALVDCASCHTAAQTSSWTGGRFHLAGAALPSTCLPCHAGERPTSDSGWLSSTYKASPFDYGGNGVGTTTHGNAQDCAACHLVTATASTQSWVGGKFNHDPAGVAGTTCIACHVSQRPTAPIATSTSPFDHSKDGTGDCIGCHQATVRAGRYVNYFNPGTGTLPGGDWQGGSGYPGPNLIGSADQILSVTEIALSRSTSTNLITGSTSSLATLYNQMLHTSAAIPAQVAPGNTPTGDPNSCWHCHTHDSSGKVTSFSKGVFHSSLTNYSAAVGGTATPLPQPSTCTDCHAQMRPIGIVEKAASDLQPMDHNAMFTAAVNINGQTVSGVAAMECATCHKSPGSTWKDGLFHTNIAGARPQDCAVCHYPLMADAPKANLSSGARYLFNHGSSQLAVQNCQVCHGGALAQAATAPPASGQWQGGAFHASISRQPSFCLDCHLVSRPAAASPTQSSVSYTFAAGGTSSNARQWMNHGASWVDGRDCVACHAADAKASGSAWSKSDSFHANVPAANTCQVCHGLGNGGGNVAGTNNNLPSGLTSSSMVSTAGADPATGVPSGTHDQITHDDINVSSRDCTACHVQAGVSTAAGVAGREWAQASFHGSTSAANPLVLNGTSGRCSNCHLNVKPPGSFGGVDHAPFTSAPGSQDCATCHSFPGTGTATSANWLGAVGTPKFITVGGFPIPQPPAAQATIQAGINNLPHPTVGTGTSCTTCHASSSGGKNALGYDHASGLSTNCAACHEAGSNLVGTTWNGTTIEAAGVGDTRPFTITSLYIAFSGNSRNLAYDPAHPHFYPVDCAECHLMPSGIAKATSGPAYLSIGNNGGRSSGFWMFPHDQGKMTDPSTCLLCHPGGPPR